MNPQQTVSGEHKTSWITISMDEYETMQSTLEVLSDSDLMNQLRKSQGDIAAGRYKTLEQLEAESKK